MSISRREIRDFWSEDAKLSIFCPIARLGKVIGVFATLLLMGLGIMFGGPKVGLDDLSSKICGIGVGLLCLLLVLMQELYEKGGNAGVKLKSSVAEATSKRKTSIDAMEMMEDMVGTADSMAFDDWYDHTLAVLTECFQPFVANSLVAIRNNGEKRQTPINALRVDLVTHVHRQLHMLREGHTYALRAKYLG